MIKICLVLTVILLLCSACSNSAEPNADGGTTDRPDESISETFTEISADAATKAAIVTLPGMPLNFLFTSGVGAWGTVVTLESDGTFTGFYHDSDMGVSGDGYPNGTRYECAFSGAFIDILKVGDYEYSMKLGALITEGKEGAERIVDGVRIITAAPYGFDNAETFAFYLPGRPTTDLPQGFLEWVDAEGDSLAFYGLYDVGGQRGFGEY
jgi:hypothetical protein